MTWGSQSKTYDLKSTTKSIGMTAVGLAIKDGKMRLDDHARKHFPKLGTPPDSNVETGWIEEITLLHLATQTAGFEKPGGFKKLLFKPGAKWSYSDGGPNWLADCVTLAYRRDIEDLLFLLNNWGSPSSDVDGNGVTDVEDMFAILNGWGICESKSPPQT